MDRFTDGTLSLFMEIFSSLKLRKPFELSAVRSQALIHSMTSWRFTHSIQLDEQLCKATKPSIYVAVVEEVAGT